jgi:hypothetical protein
MSSNFCSESLWFYYTHINNDPSYPEARQIIINLDYDTLGSLFNEEKVLENSVNFFHLPFFYWKGLLKVEDIRKNILFDIIKKL